MKKFFFGSDKQDENPPPPQNRPASLEGDSFLTGDELRDRNNVKLLLEAIGHLSSTLSLDSLLLDIVDKSIELTRAERGILFLVDERASISVRVARDSQRQELARPLQYSTTIVQQAAKTSRPLRKMVSSDSEAIDLGRSVFDLKLRAVMCAPLKVKDKLVGAIYVDSRAAQREFSKADLSFFNALSTQLGIAIENARLVTVSVEKARLEQELKIASEIQQGLLPKKAPQIAGLDLYGWYSPCEEATGDSYDFLPLDENRIAFLMCDVSGHGVGPALLSATARAALRSYLKVVPEIHRVVNFLQADLEADLKTGMFMTLFLGVYDRKQQKLSYVNAGHPSPVLARGENIALLEGFEPAFGMREGLEAKSLHVGLERGDFLVVYSDGLTEARSPQRELYGDERLVKTVKRHVRESAKEIVDGVVKEVLEFSHQQRSDDITIFAVRVP